MPEGERVMLRTCKYCLQVAFLLLAGCVHHRASTCVTRNPNVLHSDTQAPKESYRAIDVDPLALGIECPNIGQHPEVIVGSSLCYYKGSQTTR